MILEGLYFPTVGVVDSLRAGTLMREQAQEMGALEVRANTEIVGIDLSADGKRVRVVRTTGGDIETDVCAVCCGVWSPRIARMAGATIALTPIVHQMISVGPIPLFADTVGEIVYPIVRDMDTNMYERQHGGDMEVGSYAHRPIIVRPDEIPSIEESVLSPTELPFTQDDFDPQLQDALELMPELLGDESVGIRYAINGLISMTPDGHPVLGETPEVRGLVVGRSELDQGRAGDRASRGRMDERRRARDRRPRDRHRTLLRSSTHEGAHSARGPARPSTRCTGSSTRPSSGSCSGAPASAPSTSRSAISAPSSSRRWGGSGPSGTPAMSRCSNATATASCRGQAEWESRWWSPIINAEHLAMRDGCGLVDLSAFVVFDVTGPGALSALQALTVAQMDVAVGRVVYTSLLDERGGFKSDLTIMRLGPQHFRVVTGGATGMAEKKWFLDHLPENGSAQLADLTSAWTTFGLWGPRARDVLQSCTDDDVSNDGFAFGTCRQLELGGLRVLASRISYVGELGWELYVPIEEGARAWNTLWEAGRGHGIVPVGIGVYGTTGRLEKGYRAFGNELTADYDIVEAGMARPSVKKDWFVGKEPYLRQRETRTGRSALHPDRGRPPRRRAGRFATCSAASRSLTPKATGWRTRRAGPPT